MIDHGKLSVDQDKYTESEIITVQCDSGYGLVGPQNITCIEDRTWHPQVPKCEWVSGTIQGSFCAVKLKMGAFPKGLSCWERGCLTQQASFLGPSKDLSLLP